MLLDLKLTLSSSISGWDVANPNWRKAMKNGKERVVRASKKSAAMVTLALWIGGGGTMGLRAQGSMIVVQPERQVTVVQSKFYCNIKVLTPAELARKEIAEKEKGYESEDSVVHDEVAELANWVAEDSKCSDFIVIHIDDGRL